MPPLTTDIGMHSKVREHSDIAFTDHLPPVRATAARTLAELDARQGRAELQARARRLPRNRSGPPSASRASISA